MKIIFTILGLICVETVTVSRLLYSLAKKIAKTSTPDVFPTVYHAPLIPDPHKKMMNGSKMQALTRAVSPIWVEPS